MTVIVGIDPGLTGALAFMRDGSVFNVIDMPVEAREGNGKIKTRIAPVALKQAIQSALWMYPSEALAIIESQRGMPGMAVQTMHSLGDSFGVIRAVIAGLGIQSKEINPGTWKKYFGLTSEKGESIRHACALMPDAQHHWPLAKHHNRAEAALIARYGWKRWA